MARSANERGPVASRCVSGGGGRDFEWSLLAGAVGALGLWVDSQFLLAAATFLMFVLAIYIWGYIVSLGEGFTRFANKLVVAFVALGLLIAAVNFTRMVALYGSQQLQQLPPPKDPVPFHLPF
jgi:hypothetical protein